MANKLINMAVNTSPFGAELITAANSAAARSLLEVSSGGGGGDVASVNGQVGAVVLDYADVGAASAAQGVLAETALQPGDAPGAITSVNGKTGVVVLTAADVGAATTAQGAKADTALQPGDIPAAPVTSVNGQTGAVTLTPAGIGAATAAQGSKADTAVQPGSLATVATSGSYNSLTNLPTLGTAASQSAASFATAAQGALAATAVQPAALTSGLATKLDLPSAWADVVYTAPFGQLASFTRVQYRKLGNRVELKGVVSGGTHSAFPTLFTLPAGFRPPDGVLFCAGGQVGGAPFASVRVDVLTTGEVKLNTTATTSAWVSIEGLSFVVA